MRFLLLLISIEIIVTFTILESDGHKVEGASSGDNVFGDQSNWRVQIDDVGTTTSSPVDNNETEDLDEKGSDPNNDGGNMKQQQATQQRYRRSFHVDVGIPHGDHYHHVPLFGLGDNGHYHHHHHDIFDLFDDHFHHDHHHHGHHPHHHHYDHHHH